MDRGKFVDAFAKASDQLDKKKLRKITRKSVDSINGSEERGHHNLIIVMEELAELAQQTSKAARGRCDKIGLTEEMADVVLGLVYLQEICGVSTSDLYKAVNVKVDRLERVLNEKGVYL